MLKVTQKSNAQVGKNTLENINLTTKWERKQGD
jgi:hypothetical protein